MQPRNLVDAPNGNPTRSHYPTDPAYMERETANRPKDRDAKLWRLKRRTRRHASPAATDSILKSKGE